MSDQDPRFQQARWWLVSIAVSVLCCSVLFVLFAGYLDQIKSSIQDQNMRLGVIESRQNRVMIDIEALRQRETPPPPASAAAIPTVPAAPAAPDEAVSPTVTVPGMPTAPGSMPAPDAATPDKK